MTLTFATLSRPACWITSRLDATTESQGPTSEKDLEKMLAVLLDQPSLSVRALVVTLSISPRTVAKLRAKLRGKGRLEPIGAVKGG